MRDADRVGAGEVDTLAKLDELDGVEIMRGYLAGTKDATIPVGESKSFYHGWLNAQVDAGRMKISVAQQRLAREYVARGRR